MRLLNEVAAFGLTIALAAAAQAPQKAVTRPKIIGISHLAVYASEMAATDRYYREVVGAAKRPDPENPEGARYAINAEQFVEVLPLPAGAGIDRLDHTAWNTDDAEGMRKYLASKAWKVPAAVTRGSDGSQWFEVKDPEGNRVQFVEPPAHPKTAVEPEVASKHIIHVGFLVHSRADEDAFYRDLLGFRPYWWGGMKDGEIDWVAQQTPNGHDWIEYMLGSGPGKGIPAGMSQHTLGVMDHLSLGVNSVEVTYKHLEAANRLGTVHDKEPKIGKDGKWQFNMYDPDGTRLELMNFHATEKPCCSPFTAEDPAE